MHMRAQFWEAHLILREILANALEDDESHNINVRRIITQSIQARIAELQNEDPGNPFFDKGQLEYCKQVLLKTNPHQRPRDDDDEPDYFTPEIREILAQRAMGYAERRSDTRSPRSAEPRYRCHLRGGEERAAIGYTEERSAGAPVAAGDTRLSPAAGWP